MKNNMKQMLKKCVIDFNFIPVSTMNKLQKAIIRFLFMSSSDW